MRVCEPIELAYLREQTNRAQQQDQAADEWGFALLELAELVKRWGKVAITRELAVLPDTFATDNPAPAYQPTCEQCVNWRPIHTVTLSNGKQAQLGGFCESRAAADLKQMPQSYATQCRFYEEDCPF